MTVALRPARPTDAGKIGAILHQFQQAADWMPPHLSAAEYIAYCGAMIDRGWVTVAERDGRVSGFLARDGDEICGLYVACDLRGAGVGRHLLNFAKARARWLMLNVYEANTGARRFYERHGFVETGRKDGSDIDEGLPYICYEWGREGRE